MIPVATMAADKGIKPPHLTPSKVDHAKERERNKLFTPWMNGTDFKIEYAKHGNVGEKLLYFECDGAKDQWRGIFVARAQQENPYFYAVFGEKKAAEVIGEYMALGYKPSFIVPSKGYWCFTLSKGPGSETEPEALAKIGIGAPVVK